jgi:hypothetical protein
LLRSELMYCGVKPARRASSGLETPRRVIASASRSCHAATAPPAWAEGEEDEDAAAGGVRGALEDGAAAAEPVDNFSFCFTMGFIRF